MWLLVNLVLEPDDAGVVSCGCAARSRVQIAADLGCQVVCAWISQRNYYAEMPVSRVRMVSSSEVADFR